MKHKGSIFCAWALAAMCLAHVARGDVLEPTGFYKSFTATVGYGVAGEVANVPVLLRLSESGISGFRYADVQGRRFEILDAEGALLPYEIETWDESGESLLWVRVPTYKDGATLTVRYGTTLANAPLAATATWSDYVGVWHLDDLDPHASEYGSYANSTATSGIDGEKAQASIAGEDGKIGKSCRVNNAGVQSGNYNYGGVFVPDSGTGSPLDLGSTFAISGWFKHANQNFYYDHVFYKRKRADNTDSPNNAFAIEFSSKNATAKLDVRGSGGSATATPTLPTSPKNAWVYLTFVYNGNKVSVYENGARVGNEYTITAVQDNDAPLCFGNNTDGRASGEGSAAWCGWIDEVRLADATPSAAWIAAEYNAMTNLLTYTAVSKSDESAPEITTPSVVKTADDTFTISATLSVNEPDSVSCIVGNSSFPMTTSDAELSKKYSAVISGLAEGSYRPVVQARTTNGGNVPKFLESGLHVGALTVTAISSANETTMTPGVFRIARADTDPTGKPALTFGFSLTGAGAAAVADPGVSTLTIPEGAGYVELAVYPVYTYLVDEDAELTLTITSDNVGQSSSGTMTVVNSTFDQAVRYVAPTGSDANHGGTSAMPKASIASAVASLADVAQSQTCTIYVAPGTYRQFEPVRVETPIKIIGTGTAASDVTLQNATSGKHVITIAHADAELALVTLTGGSAKEGPACLSIEAGLVRDCRVTGCSYYGNGGKSGGMVLMSGGRLMRSVVDGNSITGTGWNGAFSAGVHATGGVVENCLIKGNSAHCYNDTGGIETSALSVEGSSCAVNCTIVGNSATMNGSGRKPMTTYAAKNAKIVNCVIFGNSCVVADYKVWAGTAANYVNCIADSAAAINETCSVTGDPGFIDPSNGDYSIGNASVLRDAGSSSEYSLVADSMKDLKGDGRILGSAIDVGAYEYVPSAVLAVDFSYTVNRRLLPASVTFTAFVENASGAVVYKWDFDSDGTIDRETSEPTTTFEFDSAKSYDVTLTAESGQESAAVVKQNVVVPIQKDIYVSREGAGEYPYATTNTAATSVHAALDAADDGCVVHILPGTYTQSAPFALDKAVAVVSSTTNAADVVLRNTASGERVATVSHEGAELAGVTLTGGSASKLGAALTLTAGLVRDCTMTGNGIGGCRDSEGRSGTVCMSGGRLMRCRIVENTGGISWNANCAGGVNASGGVIDTCLVATNRVSYWGGQYTTALGVKLTGDAKAINCTIANNVCTNPERMDASGNGAYPMATSASANARFVNCLIWGNVTKDGDEQRHVWNGSAASYVNCYSELTINETSPAVEDPSLVDIANGNYALAKNSPLVNKGVDYASAGGESEFDLSGEQNRIVGSRIDIGCYEASSSAFIIIVR